MLTANETSILHICTGGLLLSQPIIGLTGAIKSISRAEIASSYWKSSSALMGGSRLNPTLGQCIKDSQNRRQTALSPQTI
jgi:hypothetical protein